MALISLAGINQNKSMGGSIDWNNLFGQIIQKAPVIIDASRSPVRPSGGYNGSGINPYTNGEMEARQPTQSGISTNTMLLIGGAALVAFLLLKKK